MWVEALLRPVATDRGAERVLDAGNLSLDLEALVVRYKGEPIPRLTPKETELLHCLVKNRPKVVSRRQILSGLWRTVAVDHVVDTHIGNLRRKLSQEVSDRIHNVPGKGFRYFG